MFRWMWKNRSDVPRYTRLSLCVCLNTNNEFDLISLVSNAVRLRQSGKFKCIVFASSMRSFGCKCYSLLLSAMKYDICSSSEWRTSQPRFILGCFIVIILIRSLVSRICISIAILKQCKNVDLRAKCWCRCAMRVRDSQHRNRNICSLT